MSDEDIGLAVDYPDDPTVWVSELVSVRLLDADECGKSLHDWPHHQPWVSGHAARSKAASKAAKTRWENRGVMRDASGRIAEKTTSMKAQCPDPNTISDPKSISDSDSDSDSETKASAEPEKPLAPAPPISSVRITIPTAGKAAADYPITEADVSDWHEAYPAVPIMQELREMRQWAISNPTKRKTARGMRRFITSWLEREQNRGGARASPPHGLQHQADYKPPYHLPFPAKEA